MTKRILNVQTTYSDFRTRSFLASAPVELSIEAICRRYKAVFPPETDVTVSPRSMEDIVPVPGRFVVQFFDQEGRRMDWTGDDFESLQEAEAFVKESREEGAYPRILDTGV